MNYKNDQFYNDMQNIKNNSLPVQKYISNNFGNFWNSFYNYLSYFHKPITQRFVKPKSYLDICFESVIKILDNATIENYNASMKDSMINCFKSMLHPDNSESIKQEALEFFIIIYPRLKLSDVNYTGDFEQYFFDFSFADSNLKIKSINHEMRIQLSDQEKSSFDSKIESFLDRIFKAFIAKPNDDYIKAWWAFIQKYIVGIFYYSIFRDKPKIQGIGKLTDKMQDIEENIIDFLIKVTQNGFLDIILSVENSPDYITDILYYLSSEPRISKINSLDFIKEFMKALIKSNSKVVDILYENNYHLLLELMSILINSLNYAFNKDISLIPDITKTITVCFNKIFKLFNDDYKYELCTHISHFNQITNSSCFLHFLTLLLCLFINNRVTDKKIWDIIVNSEAAFDLNLILSCYAHFAGYFATFVFSSFLGLDVAKLTKSFYTAENLGKYLNLNDFIWSTELGYALTMEYHKMYISLRQYLIHSLVAITPGITSIQMIDLFPNENLQTLQKDEIRQLLRVMFSSFTWQNKKYENDELIQFNGYLVNASFITPILKISNVVSPDIDFDRNFLIDEFLPYLKNCIKSSGSNLLIKLHALTTLGNIICWKTSLSALDKYSLADWYITLHDLIINGGDSSSADDESKSDLKMKIKISALTFACRSIILGFEGSSILLKTIANNFDLLNHINASESGSEGRKIQSSKLSSYLVEEGFELLTSSDTASLLVSLCNVCEISNIFSFNCYDSNENDQNNNDGDDQRKIKDELKLKLIQNCIGTVHPSLCAAVITALISEEAEANRCNETNLNKLLSILFQYFKDTTPEKVYASTTITFVLPELEKVKKGSVALILNEAIEALEEKKTENESDWLLFGRFAEFVVDLLIYSSFIIDTKEQLKRFSKIASSWEINDSKKINQNGDINDDLNEMKKETKQRLQYAVLSLTTHYLRFPPPTPSFSLSDESESPEEKNFSTESNTKLPAASFGSSKDCIIRVCDNEIASLLPVGQFTWNFKSVAPKPQKRAVSEDISISESASNVSDHPTQIEFTNKFVNFVDDLYTNHFTEITEETNNKNEENGNDSEKTADNSNIDINNNDAENSADNKTEENVNDTENIGSTNSSDFNTFEVCNRHLYEPGDFESSFSPSLDTKQVNIDTLVCEKLPPHSVGPKSATFLSSLNFFDSQLTNRLSPAAQDYKGVEITEFRHVIHVGFITLKSTENDDHYIDFKAGLGLLNESKTSIICADSRHQLVFHLDCQKLKESLSVYICWDEENPNDEWTNSFDSSNQRFRIEIKPTHTGLFKVTVLVNKNQHDSRFCCLSNVLVSKNNLPNFVISQIIINVHVLDFQNNKIERVQLKNGIDIRKKREENFIPYSLLLNCENTLLTKANSNNFDDIDNNEN